MKTYVITTLIICLFLPNGFGQQNLPEPGQYVIDISSGPIWYHVIGETDATPIVMMHGGPGGTSAYLYPLAVLSDTWPVILFDQPGTGRSGSLTDTTLMTIGYMVDQVHEFIDSLGLKTYYLYGHSWGTTLGLEYYLAYPEGIEALIFNSPLASTAMWVADADTLIATLPDSIQQAIDDSEASGNFDDPEYREAERVYYSQFISRHRKNVSTPWDVEYVPGNSTMYEYMWGPSEFTATGTLRDYDRLDRLEEIEVPTLWVTGEYDEARPSTVRYYHSLTPGSRFEVIDDAAHGTMFDNQEENVEVIREFLLEVER